ncbi:hypothetical protein QTP86_011080 [Hemibagrus guttatus]|nr:hypothetical protein QTP86_011080 [Hemibagrus guttatus]
MRGHYEYLVMPYGLTNVPPVFQSFINEIFKDVMEKYVIAYIDNNLIYSPSYEDHGFPQDRAKLAGDVGKRAPGSSEGKKTGPNSMDSSGSPSDLFRDLVETLWQALAELPAPAPPSPAATSANTATSVPLCVSPMAQPAPYSGSEDCNGFILQCSLVLEMQPHLYPTERSKVAFIISQLRGQALLWAESLWSQNSPVTQSYAGFVDHFKEVFGKPSWDSSVGEELCRLQQGKLTVPEYALQFRTLAAKSGWNEQAPLAAYRQGLNPQVRLHLAAYEDTIRLERLIQLSIRVAARMQSCVTEPQDQSPHSTWSDRPAPVSSPEPAPEPMHLGASHLTPAERQRRLTRNLCLYCGAPGHALPECPIRPPRPMWSPSSIPGQQATSSRAPSVASLGSGPRPHDPIPSSVHHREALRPTAGQP